MPVELKELVVKATVREEADTASQRPHAVNAELSEQERRELIQDCVELIMEILDEKYHR